MRKVKATSCIQSTAGHVKPGGKTGGPPSKPKYLSLIHILISMLVNALYNIVDQIFIGQGVGYLGNAATTVAFPIVTIVLAVSTLLLSLIHI